MGAELLRFEWVLVLASVAASVPPPQADAVNVTVCELVQKPLDYQNRIVRVQGTVQAGFELFGVVIEGCPLTEYVGSHIWLDAVDSEVYQYSREWSLQRFIQAASSGELKGDGPAVAWEAPIPVTPLQVRQRKRLSRALKKSDDGRIRAIVTGRFDYTGDGLLVRSDGRITWQKGFGHLNCCVRRIVYGSIEVENRLTTP